MAHKKLFVCAGGTGGHLFPAHALAGEMQARGWEVHLLSDERIERYAMDFPCDGRHIIPSATFSGRNPLVMAKALWRLVQGFRAARKLVLKLRPDVVVGFGGYPTVPPLMAASTMAVPCLVHEANAVLGRANKTLAPRMRAIASGFAIGSDGIGGHKSTAVHTGNPVRAATLELADTPYQASSGDEPFYLTVFGGSQGAQVFGEVVPKAIAMLPEGLQSRLVVTQQTREDEVEAVRSAYDLMGVSAEISTFFSDMPRHLAHSQLVVCRAGASSIADITVIGRPSILVPYPHALDNDQGENAKGLAAVDGAQVCLQAEFTPDWLAAQLTQLMDDGTRLSEIASAAKLYGKPEATSLLADVAERVAADEDVQMPNLTEE